jgi:hypothetical protein
MAGTTRAAREPMQINPHKIAAVLAQLGSFATTYGCVIALKKSNTDAFGWIAIGLDTLLNAGGIWPMVQVLDKAPSWIMLKESMGMDGDMGKLPALVVALVLGYLLSIAPHRLWRGGS